MADRRPAPDNGAVTPTREQRRPRGVTALVVLGLLQGLLLTAVGVALILLRDDADLAENLETNGAGVLTTGIAFALVGLLYLVLATGLARGGARIRTVYAVIAVIQVASAVYALVALRDVRFASVWGAGLGTLVLWLLYGSERAEEFFAG